MDTSSINAQSIFDDNAAALKLSWLTGHEGWERGFSSETVANATSSADLVGHLNLIHPNRIQVLGDAEINYYQRQSDEDRSRHMAELIALEPPFLVVAGEVGAPPELVSALHALVDAALHDAHVRGGRDRQPARVHVAHSRAARHAARRVHRHPRHGRAAHRRLRSRQERTRAGTHQPRPRSRGG